MEVFKPIPEYKGIYEVSNKGTIKTDKDKTTYTKGVGVRHWKQRIMKLKTDKGGYKRVTLWKDGKSKDFLVHRLVAAAFIPNPKGYELINHRDGNPSNNNVSNLEWTDYYGNLMHAYNHDLNKEAQPIVLVNSKTKESHYFYSKAEASRFLKHNDAFISAKLKNNKNVVGDYKIFVLANTEVNYEF